MGRRTVAATSIVLLAATSACTSSSGGSSSSSSSSAATSAPVPDNTAGDGVLRLGLLFPETGPGAALGQSLRGGADLAVQEINAAGGVLGRSIETVHRDEGAASTTATSAIDQLLGRDIDFIIGPASSRSAYSVLSHAVESGVGVCSPTNTAIGLDDYPDENLYFRTVPSDLLQAEAIGELVERTGRTTVAVLAPDDDYGTNLADAVVDDLRRRNLDVPDHYRYDVSSGDSDAAANDALDAGPESLVLIGSGASGAAMLTAVRAIAPELAIFVNDAMKSATVVTALGERAGVLLADVTGVGPHAEPNSASFATAFAATEPDLSDDFAAYAYDCVNLVAVAAAAAGSDDPRDVIAQFEGISRSGSPCETFAECAAILADGQNINLRGASGELELGTDGNVLTGLFRVFRFDSTGTPMDGQLIDVP